MSEKVDIASLAKKLKEEGGWITDVNTLHNLDGIFNLDSSFESIYCDPAIIDRFKDQHLKPLVKLNSLRTLYLANCRKLTDDGIRVLAGITSLEEIAFINCDQLSEKGLKALTALTSFKRLNLQQCSHIADSTLQVLAKLNNLEDLNLSFCDKFTDNGLRLLASLPNLRIFNVFWCSQLTNDSVLIISKFPVLRELHLGRSEKITCAGFRHLVSNCKSLIKLDLQQSETIDDETLEIISQLTTLERLVLCKCENITNNGLQHLAKLLSLKDLDVSDCYFISIAGLEYLARSPDFMYLRIDNTLVTKEQEESFLKQLKQNQQTKESEENQLKMKRVAEAEAKKQEEEEKELVLQQADVAALAKKLKQDGAWIKDVNILHSLDRIFHIDSSFEAIYCDPAITDRVQDRHLKPLLNLKSLKRLYLNGCKQLTDEGIQVLAGLSLVEYIDLNSCKQLSDKGLKVLAALTFINRVNLQSCNIIDSTLGVLSKITTLEDLGISFCDKFTNEGLQLLASLPKLHILDVKFCSQLTDDSLLIVSKFPALRELAIGVRRNVTSVGFRHLVANCKLLTKLDVGQSETVDDEILEIISNLSTIQDIVLFMCDKITNNGMKYLAKLLSLRSAFLNGCKLVSNDGLTLLVNLPVLALVYVDNTLVTKEQHEAFMKQLEENQAKQQADPAVAKSKVEEIVKKTEIQQQTPPSSPTNSQSSSPLALPQSNSTNKSNAAQTLHIVVPQNDHPTNTDLSNNISSGNAAIIKTVKQESAFAKEEVLKTVKDEVAKLTAAFESLHKNEKYSGAFYKGDPSNITIFEDLVLGTGSFSTVFLASMAGKKIAAKRLNPDPRRDIQQQADATAREAQMLMASNNPDVVRCYGVLVQKPFTYILLEKCECNLQEFVSVLGSDLQLHHRVYLASSIARAISHLHSQHIIFADLKPQNILISVSGDCRLSDFGSAANASSSTSSLLLMSGVTAVFAAPELRTSGHSPTYASDVFALGVVCCEIITGEEFFIDSLSLEKFENNSALLHIIKRCISREPSSRSSATTVADTLRNEILPAIDQDFAEEPENELISSLMMYRKKAKKVASPITKL